MSEALDILVAKIMTFARFPKHWMAGGKVPFQISAEVFRRLVCSLNAPGLAVKTLFQHF